MGCELMWAYVRLRVANLRMHAWGILCILALGAGERLAFSSPLPRLPPSPPPPTPSAFSLPFRGGEERLAFSVLWEMTPDADIVSATFTKSIIRRYICVLAVLVCGQWPWCMHS